MLFPSGFLTPFPIGFFNSSVTHADHCIKIYGLIREQFLLQKSGDALAEVAQESPSPGGVPLRDVVSGHSGDGLGLDLVILEVFSNLSDSMKIQHGH